MNSNFLFAFLSFLLFQLAASAQDVPLQKPLELTFHKTTSLIFPYAIKSVDRGSGDVLAQVPPEVGNVLQVKAARKGFAETNITVITADGKLYSFPIIYMETPATTLVRFDSPSESAAPVLFKEGDFNQRQLENISAHLSDDIRFYYGIKDKVGGVKATLAGIYIHGNTLFYRVVLTNASPVPYTVDFTRFTVRDRKRAKRTATQEEELTPLYAYHASGKEDKTVHAGHREVMVLALEKHTLASGKELVLDLFEKNGGRHLRLKVHDRDILQACPLLLPDEADF